MPPPTHHPAATGARLRRHSFRMDGHVTSIRIEDAYFDVLFKLARTQGATLNAVLRQLHRDYQREAAALAASGCFTAYVRLRCFHALRPAGALTARSP